MAKKTLQDIRSDCEGGWSSMWFSQFLRTNTDHGQVKTDDREPVDATVM